MHGQGGTPTGGCIAQCFLSSVLIEAELESPLSRIDAASWRRARVANSTYFCSRWSPTQSCVGAWIPLVHLKHGVEYGVNESNPVVGIDAISSTSLRYVRFFSPGTGRSA